MRRLRYHLALSLLALHPLALAAQLDPPSTGGYAALDHALRLLGHQKRVLMIAAHPDDEDTELLTVLVRGMGAEAGYLSLNRGEGGQNLIGDELGEALGLLRSEELLAARRLDGARQFFTRAYDFGFSKNLTDTWAHWPRDSVLKDVVRIVRRFRPQIVVSIFSGTPRDGHGQHQAAGWAAQEAYRVAGDSAVFPELWSEEGLGPFAPLKLYRSTRFDTSATTLTLDGGELDPAVGQSFHQIAMQGRSLHRSQDMGQLQGMGPSVVRLQLIDDRTGKGRESFWSGVDTTLESVQILASLSSVDRRQVDALLAAYSARVDSARALLGAPLREGLRDLLARAEGDLQTAEQQMGHGMPTHLQRQIQLDRAREGDLLLGEGRRLGRARMGSLELVADGISEDARVTPGQRIQVTASLWNASGQPADGALCVGSADFDWRLTTDSGGRVELPRSPRGACMVYDAGRGGLVPEASARDSVPPKRLITGRLLATVPESEAYSSPYFLRSPRAGDLYRWDPAARDSWGLPFEAPRFVVTVAGPPSSIAPGTSREISLRGNDQGSGEFRRPITVVPRVDVALKPEQEIWPIGDRGPRTFIVTLMHGGRDTTEGTIHLELPRGWAAVTPQPFRFTQEDERATFEFRVGPPATARAGRFEVAAVARDTKGRAYDVGVSTVDHPHIHPRSWTRRAVGAIDVMDLRLPRLKRIGYIRGAADRVPEGLMTIGLPVTLISGADLAKDMSRFAVIVVGPRAFETDPDLPANNDHLLAYARGGGTVIMQYQQYGYFLGGFTPYPLTVGARAPGAAVAAVITARLPARGESTALFGGHDRVTDETAPVTAINGADPLLLTPNRIGPSDWQDWVQERGLYFAHSWTPDWRPVLEMHDPGEAPLEGGLLVSRVGKGTYVYTGISFFRQLPAGVPGAWRLFANLLALGEARTAPVRRPAAHPDSLQVERE